MEKTKILFDDEKKERKKDRKTERKKTSVMQFGGKKKLPLKMFFRRSLGTSNNSTKNCFFVKNI
jgi:hypothetical protein